MIKIKEENVQKMLEVMRKITEVIPKEHQHHIYWCPKTISDDGEVAGYRLYAYGGYVLRIFEENKELKFETNFNTYKESYFGELWDESFEEMYRQLHKENIDTLLKITPHMKTILEAYKKWKKLERRRETAIARNLELHSKTKDFYIIDMESRIKTSGKKPDLIGIRNENGKTILSFIEYKCTKSGMDGVTLVTHYEDMIDYYKNVKMDAGYETLYKQMQDFAELKMLQLDCGFKLGEIEGGEIVFLFSNIGTDDLTAQKVYNNIRFLIERLGKHPEHKQNVKFLILKDENELYLTDNYMNSEEILKHEIFANCNKEQWKRIQVKQ